MDGGSNLRGLVEQKEKELHEVNEYRYRTIERKNKELEVELVDQKQRFSKLKEDFEYNLKLIEERDAELVRFEESFQNLKSLLREKDIALSEAKVAVSDQESHNRTLKEKIGDLEKYYQDKVAQLRDDLEKSKFNADDTVRHQQENYEATIRKLTAELREKEQIAFNEKDDMSQQFTAEMRKRDQEADEREHELTSNIRSQENKIRQLTGVVETFQQNEEEWQAQVDRLRQDYGELETQFNATHFELEQTRKEKDTRILQLETEKNDLSKLKQQLLDEYEGKMSELLNNLHAVERAFIQQKEDFESDLRKVAEETEEYRGKMERRIKELTQTLHDVERDSEEKTKSMKRSHYEWDAMMKEKRKKLEEIEAQLEKERGERESEVKGLKNELWNRDVEMSGMREKLEQLKETLEERRVDLNNYKAELVAAGNRETDLKRELVQRNLQWEKEAENRERSETAKNEEIVRTLQSQRDRANSLLKAADEKCVNLETEVHRARNELNLVRTELKNVQARRVQEREEAEQIAKLSASRAAAASPVRVSNNASSLDELMSPSKISLPPFPNTPPLGPPPVHPNLAGTGSSSGEMDAVRERNRALEDENTRFKAVIGDMRKEMESLQASSRKHEMAALLSGGQPDGLPGQDGETKNVIHDLSKMVEALRDDLQSARGECTRLRDELAQCTDEKKRLRERMSDMEGELDERRRTITRLESDVGDIRRSASSAHGDETRKLNREIQRLQAELLELPNLQERVGQLQQINSTLSQENANLSSELSDAQSDIRRLKGDKEKLMEIGNMLRADLNMVTSESYAGPIGGAGSDLEKKIADRYESKIAEIEKSMMDLVEQNRVLKENMGGGRTRQNMAARSFDSDLYNTIGESRETIRTEELDALSSDGDEVPRRTPGGNFAPATSATRQRLNAAKANLFHVSGRAAARPHTDRPQNVPVSQRATPGQEKARQKVITQQKKAADRKTAHVANYARMRYNNA